jgi:hydrogenase nickel incorporation protein HypA/HybF
MHELPIVESILNIVLKHAQQNNAKKVVSISLKIGEMSDLIDEWVQRYFDYLSKGTIAEGAKLKIEKVPVVLKCEACGSSFQVDIRKDENIKCTQCNGDKVTLVSGREFHISSMEVM